ncbi:Actin-binding protein [Nakaseomyces bracarensis]|uniref:Actin-binding protein n=1 Tax=Nakaseomyces bracarensis TaxID=273131 RepID=A0ABR4NSG6_9SACH
MALEPIKYGAHGAAIEAEWLKVVRGGDDAVEWLVIAPNAEEKGEYFPWAVGAGFSEFLGSFADEGASQVRYGIARVSPPGSDVQKVLLVGWCPDGAGMKARASFAANFGTVANNLLKGYHVQVAARDEDDLDEKELLMKISNAAGARYSIQASSGGSTATTASGSGNVRKMAPPSSSSAKVSVSTPKPSSPSPPPSARPPTTTHTSGSVAAKAQDDDDWDEPAVAERDLDRNPVKPTKSTYQPIGKVDLQRTIAEEKQREDPRLVNSTRPPTATAASHDDKVIRGFRTEKTPAQLWAERKAKERADDSNTNTTSNDNDNDNDKDKDNEKDSAGVSDEEHDVKDLRSKFESLGKEPPIIQPRAVRDEPPARATADTASAGGAASAGGMKDLKKIGNPLPGMHSEEPEEEDEDDDWDEEEEEEKPRPLPVRDEPAPAPAPAPRPAPAQPESEPEPEQEEEPEEPEQQEEPAQQEEEPQPEHKEEPEKKRAVPPPPPRREEKKWAIAEYDYEAAEDNELTFAENDKIVNIEFVDDDWWLGELESGEKGLFPSNYVSLGN